MTPYLNAECGIEYGVPYVTIRENTERPIAVTHGTNPPPFGDGKAAERIVEILVK